MLKTEGKHIDDILEANKHFDEYLSLRKSFHNEKLIEKRWKEVITSNFLYPSNLKNLYFKYLDNYPALKRGFNQAEFKTTVNRQQKVDSLDI